MKISSQRFFSFLDNFVFSRPSCSFGKCFVFSKRQGRGVNVIIIKCSYEYQGKTKYLVVRFSCLYIHLFMLIEIYIYKAQCPLELHKTKLPKMFST